MKKYVLLIFVCCVSTLIFTQKKTNSFLESDLNLIQQALTNKSPVQLEDVKRKFPIYNINNVDYLSMLCKTNSSFKQTDLKKNGIIVGTKIGDIITLKVPLSKMSELTSYSGFSYLEIALKTQQNLDQAIKDVRADSVQKGINLPQAYTGKDVYIGIADWGFDYSHPNFYDTLLNETRIAAAWDQYKQSGPAPSGFTYGTEYNTVDELLLGKSDTANIYSYAYHGSHVAGITGGSGAGTPYRGVAFEAQFLMATFLIDAASVIDAYEWMYQKSIQDQKRLVINQSWGLHHMGNLDGTSILSEAIDYYSQLGVIFVSSDGNNGDVNFHIKKEFVNDTILSKINFYTYTFPTMWGQSISLWGEESKAFSVGFKVLNVGNVRVAETPYYTTNLLDHYVDSMLIVGTDTIFFNLSSENQNPLNNRPHVRMRIKNEDPSLRIVMKLAAADGIVHAWNVVELTNDVGNWGLPFSKIVSTYTAGDMNYGISEPACTKSTIAVAAYSTNSAIAGFSSLGPTLDERVKPDIAAPGVNIASSLSSYTDASVSTLTTVDFLGRTYPFGRLSGTSMSGPMVTGIVALLLEANPYLSASQMKEIIQQTAREDGFTGTIPTEGSLTWGAGKINAYQAVKLALQTFGNVEVKEKSASLIQFFPNPVAADLKINLPVNEQLEVQIVNLEGKVFKKNLVNQSISLSEFSSGIYTIRFIYQGRVYQEKIIKQ